MRNGWTARPSRPFGRALIVVSAVLCLFGLWTSLQYSLAFWGTDADVANNVMLWWGFKQHGLRFLTSWYYTQDNWLLSLVPLAFLQFALVGVKPFLVVVSGWAIFVTCVGLALLVARQLAGRAACFVLAPFLLLSNMRVLGWPDFFGYPCTHNISLFWGLLAMLAASRWLGAGGAPLLAAVFAILVIDGISDPWSEPAFLLPMLLAALLCLTLPDVAVRRRAALLAGTILAAGLFCWTKIFGVFSFLPKDKLVLAAWPQVNANAVALMHTVAVMFRPFPRLDSNWAIPDALTCAVLGMLIWAALAAILRQRDLTPARLFLLAVMLLSIGGVTLAILIGTFEDVTVIGRFWLNAYLFVPIIICTGVGRAAPGDRLLRSAAPVLAGLVMLAGAASLPSAWWRHRVQIDDKGTVALAAFLQSHGLHWGYGDYFGTQSNAVSWVSGGKVLVRPVMFDPVTGRISARPSQTSPSWYGAAAAPPGPSFVIVTPASCAPAATCLSGLASQFGPPDRRLDDGAMRVLVWNRPLPLRLSP